MQADTTTSALGPHSATVQGAIEHLEAALADFVSTVDDLGIDPSDVNGPLQDIGSLLENIQQARHLVEAGYFDEWPETVKLYADSLEWAASTLRLVQTALTSQPRVVPAAVEA